MLCVGECGDECGGKLVRVAAAFAAAAAFSAASAKFELVLNFVLIWFGGKIFVDLVCGEFVVVVLVLLVVL